MNLITTEINPKQDRELLMGIKDNKGEQKSTQSKDSQYQEIVYCKGRIMDRVPDNPNKMVSIDLQKALDETANLVIADPNFKNPHHAWIVFYNQKNFDSFDILRTGDDLWNVSTPIFCSDPICRYKHIAHLNTRRLEDTIRAFFEADDWYGIVDFVFDHQMFEIELSLCTR